MERSLARKTDALVTVAPSVKKELLERHGVGRIDQYSVIPSGYPDLRLEGVRSLREELGLGTSVVAGMAGRMVPVKGIDLLMKTIPRILEEVDDLKFVIAGDGPLFAKLESFAARGPFADAIRVLGNRKDIERFFKTLDMLVLPSIKEGLPTVLLEAVASGVPVAASRIPGVLDLFKDRETALLFEAGSVSEFSSAVIRLARDPGLRRGLAEKAAKEIPIKVPGYQGVAESHARLYQGLVEQMKI
jgi:glycosyltransferase involved in cell wall biosynthesis